jgi:hypothetical protein
MRARLTALEQTWIRARALTAGQRAEAAFLFTYAGTDPEIIRRRSVQPPVEGKQLLCPNRHLR